MPINPAINNRPPPGRRPIPIHFAAVAANDAQRHTVEHFIHQQFARSYDADIRQFMPTLLAQRNTCGQLSAVVGIRSAANEKLFLENYLDQPVEHVITQRTGRTVTRNKVVEIGNLAVAHAGGAHWLIMALSVFLYAAEYEWAVFTAVPRLLSTFRKLGLNPEPLAIADKSRITDADQQWGSYYANNPIAVSIHIRRGVAALQAALLLEQFQHNTQQRYQSQQQLWNNAYAAGKSIETPPLQLALEEPYQTLHAGAL
ncbi:MAG: thermostable hemolysin [Gammaproteobacteria bacterium]|nr:thermostable hemolysin [Gammaproteobacteria bacterium]